MGRMTNIIILARVEHHVHRITEIEKSENIAFDWNRDKKQEQIQERKNSNGCEQYSGNRSTGTNRRIVWNIFIEVIV